MLHTFASGIHEHWISSTNFVDVQASYSVIFTPPEEQAPVAGYSKSGKDVVKSKRYDHFFG